MVIFVQNMTILLKKIHYLYRSIIFKKITENTVYIWTHENILIFRTQFVIFSSSSYINYGENGKFNEIYREKACRRMFLD